MNCPSDQKARQAPREIVNHPDTSRLIPVNIGGHDHTRPWLTAIHGQHRESSTSWEVYDVLLDCHTDQSTLPEPKLSDTVTPGSPGKQECHEVDCLGESVAVDETP